MLVEDMNTGPVKWQTIQNVNSPLKDSPSRVLIY